MSSVPVPVLLLVCGRSYEARSVRCSAELDTQMKVQKSLVMSNRSSGLQNFGIVSPDKDSPSVPKRKLTALMQGKQEVPYQYW
jgi:hypothetical protein